ncbi:MAG: hypothetical protein Q8N70_00070, partial [Deltaproteobacteria bacterium]|nr:hypothetical protein [Deltaproteobacteria bacterium]
LQKAVSKDYPQQADNTLQKTAVQTFRASFATETLSAHCGQGNHENQEQLANPIQNARDQGIFPVILSWDVLLLCL